MSRTVTPNDLDRAVMAMKRSNGAMPELCRRLREGDLWFLMKYHPEIVNEELEIREGMPLPFVQMSAKGGATVPVFSSEARVREGLKRGKAPPRAYLPAFMPALQLLEILGKAGCPMTLNKGCTTGEILLPAVLLRDLADGSALKPLGIGSGKPQELTLTLLKRAEYPAFLLQSAVDLFRKHAHFRAAWFFTRTEPGQPPPALCPYYVMVLMDPRDEVILHEFNLVAQSAREKHEVSTSLADEKDPAEIARLFRLAKPFYVAADYHPPAVTEGGGSSTSPPRP